MTLPVIALGLAAIGGLLIALDFALQSHPASTSPPPAESAAPGRPSPTIDGQIAEGEYAHRYRDEATGIDLHWTVLGDQIYFGMHSPGGGWAALALSPSGPLMQGGDIIIGYVSGGALHIQDNHADGPTSHQADVELGGQDDILEAAGSEAEESTVIEFRRKLDTGDPYDNSILAGEEEIQLAYSDADDFSTYHARHRSIATLEFLGK